MSLLTLPPSRAPMVGANGLVSADWYRFFHDLTQRVGGVTGNGTEDLTLSQFEDAGIEETKAWLYKLSDDIAQNPLAAESIPQQMEAMTAEIEELRGLVLELRRDLEAAQQGTTL